MSGIVSSVFILDEFMTGGHRLIITGRNFEGRPAYLNSDGEWEPIHDYGATNDEGAQVGTMPPGISLPAGVLDAIVAKATGTTPPQAATERHLNDAIAVRDRLLTLVEQS